jgi:CIC family chloride channel protein
MANSETNFEGLLSCIPLGMAVGVISALFIWSIYIAEDAFNKFPRRHYTRHMLGMFIVGLSMYYMMENYGAYYIQGVGYSTVYEIFLEKITSLEFLMFLAFFTIFNTAMTLGSGGSGGIFSPSLFIGAAIGSGMGKVIGSESDLSAQFFALAGMAGMVGATTGAVITSVVMVAEMANNLMIIMPMMLAVAVSYVVRWIFIKDSIYTLHLTRSGRILPRSQLTIAAQPPGASGR